MLYKRLRHSGTIYTGAVGAPVRPSRAKPAAIATPPLRRMIRFADGPFAGKSARLDHEHGAPETLTFMVGGLTGRYVGAHWIPSS